MLCINREIGRILSFRTSSQTGEKSFPGQTDSSPVCAPVRNDREIKHMLRLSLGFIKSVRQLPTERQSERMRAVMRGDGAQKPFRLGKRFFLSMLFLSKKRKSIGPAQRPRPFGLEYFQRRADDIRPYGQTHTHGRNPPAGGASPAPTSLIRRRIRNVGEGLAPPARDDKIPHQCAHRFGMTVE